MDKDRTEICKIISDMLDNPDKHGYPASSTAFTRLEHYVEQERVRAIGWTHAECCVTLDKGDDPRLIEIPEMLDRAKEELGKVKKG